MGLTRSATSLILFFLTLLGCAFGAGVGLSDSSVAATLNENQIFYLFSTSGQVLAAVYGLTLTGFVFFRNELSRQEADDESLADAIHALKDRYFSLLMFITALVLLTLLLTNLAIAYEERLGTTLLGSIILNLGQSSFAVSLLAIAYFIYDSMHPKRIELASKRLQKEMDPPRDGQVSGNLEEFLGNYNAIEEMLATSAQAIEVTLASAERRMPRTPNSRMAEYLFRRELIDSSLHERLRRLIALRNSIVHGADPRVSSEVVQASRAVREELEAALRVSTDAVRRPRPHGV